MTTVTISPKYQVVIPQEVRERMSIVPGEKLQVLFYQGRIEFIPVSKMNDMKGFLKDPAVRFEREADRV